MRSSSIPWSLSALGACFLGCAASNVRPDDLDAATPPEHSDAAAHLVDAGADARRTTQTPTDGATAFAADAASGSHDGGLAADAGAGFATECTADDDCTLFTWDCCSCLALAPGETGPSCPADCSVGACERLGLPAPRCIRGACVLDISCEPTQQACEERPLPECPPGQALAQVNGCPEAVCLPRAECGRDLE